MIAKKSKTTGGFEEDENDAGIAQLQLFATKQRLNVAKHKQLCGRQGSSLAIIVAGSSPTLQTHFFYIG